MMKGIGDEVGGDAYGGVLATHTPTREQARRSAVRAALLDAQPTGVGPSEVHPSDARTPDGLVDMVGALGMLRVELTTTVAPAADHAAWSRLGASDHPADTEGALASGQLFERGWMLHLMSDLGLYLAGMRTWAARTGARGWMDDNAAFARTILSRIADDGPRTSREIPDEAVAPWPSTGWNNNRNVTQMLECLHRSGELAVVGREGPGGVVPRLGVGRMSLPAGAEGASRRRAPHPQRASARRLRNHAGQCRRLADRAPRCGTRWGTGDDRRCTGALAGRLGSAWSILRGSHDPAFAIRPADDRPATCRPSVRVRLSARDVQTGTSSRLGKVRAADPAR